MKQFVVERNDGELEVQLMQDNGDNTVIINKAALASFDSATELASDIVALATAHSAEAEAGYTGAVEALEQDNENLRRTMEAEAEEYKAEVRAETAREIFTAVFDIATKPHGVYAMCYALPTEIEALAKQYGVQLRK